MALLTGNERVNSVFGQQAGQPMVNSGQSFEVGAGHLTSAGGSVSTAQLDVTASTALVTVPGLSNTIIQAGTYRFVAYLPGTSNTSGGVKYAFTYTGMTLTSMSAVGIANTVSAQALAVTTTTASQTSLVSSTSAAVYCEIIGSFVVGSVAVNTGGSIALQFAQSASTAATSSVYQGAYLQIARVS